MLKLYLHHGRKTPNEKLEDWGPDGPVLKNVVGVHQTYGNGPNIYFANRQAMLAAQELTGWTEWDDNALIMKWEGDLVEVKEFSGSPMFYADWGLIK